MNPKFKHLPVSREGLPEIIKDNLFDGTNKLKIAEVGVFYGYYLDNYYPKFEDAVAEFNLIDLWSAENNDDLHSKKDDKLKIAYDRVLSRHGHKDNVFMHKGSSVDMADKFEDASLDYVYIDADHRYEGVLADITAWYPKVKSGGFICGHDTYPSPGHESGNNQDAFGVARAVEDFFGDEVENIYLTNEQYFQSWVYRKD